MSWKKRKRRGNSIPDITTEKLYIWPNAPEEILLSIEIGLKHIVWLDVNFLVGPVWWRKDYWPPTKVWKHVKVTSLN